MRDFRVRVRILVKENPRDLPESEGVTEACTERIGMAAQHSQSLAAWLLHIPGLVVVAPGMAYDAKGLLKSVIRSNNPVVFFENKLLYAATGAVPESEYLVPLGRADVKRTGSDVTVAAVGAMVGVALAAAESLARDGIDVEVVDPRTLFPCD